MKDELNSYKITNPDGASKEKYSERKMSYSNDNPRYIREDILTKQREISDTSETFDAKRRTSRRTSFRENKTGYSEEKSASSKKAKTDASSTVGKLTTATTGIGGSIGAAAGIVASTVVTAVMVVAAFISTLTIDISLVMADMYQLVFLVEMQGAQEEDFASPIVAMLDGGGSHREQQVFADSTFLTFSDLTPNTEYIIRIKNDEKVFVEKSFFTASKPMEKGTLSAWKEGEEIVVSVREVVVGGDGLYTVMAKNENGNVIFITDDVKKDNDFRFSAGQAKSVYITLSVGGTTYAMAKVQVIVEPESNETPAEYDFDDYSWTWSSDLTNISFKEIHGGEPLTVNATVNETITEPTCLSKGSKLLTATVIYNGRTYTDEKTIETEALGHDYEAVFTWEETTEGGFGAVAKLTCKHDAQHIMNVDAVVTDSYIEATCEEDAYILYTATATYNDEKYFQEKSQIITGTAIGHSFGAPVFEWKSVSNDEGSITGDDIPQYVATAVFVCKNDSNHKREIEVTDIRHEGALPGCEQEGRVIYYASVEFEGEYYEDEYEVVLPATGHDYAVEFYWEDDTNARAFLNCSHDNNHISELQVRMDSNHFEPTCTEDGYTVYTATAEYEGKTYNDERTIIEDGTAIGHSYIITGEWVDNGNGGYSATAIISCENGDFHDEIEIPQDDVWSEEIVAVSCDHEGEIIYHAGAESKYGTINIDHTVYLSLLGHDYNVEFSWDEGIWEATAVLICSHNSEHIVELEVTTTSEHYDAVDEGYGYTIYTAVAEYEGVNYQDVKRVGDDGSVT